MPIAQIWPRPVWIQTKIIIIIFNQKQHFPGKPSLNCRKWPKSSWESHVLRLSGCFCYSSRPILVGSKSGLRPRNGIPRPTFFSSMTLLVFLSQWLSLNRIIFSILSVLLICSLHRLVSAFVLFSRQNWWGPPESDMVSLSRCSLSLKYD